MERALTVVELLEKTKETRDFLNSQGWDTTELYRAEIQLEKWLAKRAKELEKKY